MQRGEGAPTWGDQTEPRGKQAVCKDIKMALELGAFESENEESMGSNRLLIQADGRLRLQSDDYRQQLSDEEQADTGKATSMSNPNQAPPHSACTENIEEEKIDFSKVSLN